MPRSRKTERPDEIGRWSEEKLELLEKYLHAYSVIMNKQRSWLKAYHYIDAFAGSVRPKPKGPTKGPEKQSPSLLRGPESVPAVDLDADAERYIEGSPLRALRTEPPFDVYWFMDLSPWRITQLNQLRKEHPDRDIRIKQGDCNLILRGEIATMITRESNQRGVVLLDPYGLEVEWETVVALAEAYAFDIFVNFSLMHVTRLLKRDEPPDEDVIKLIDRVMGDSNWVQELYKPPRQLSMFDEQELVRDVIRAEWLAGLYADRVKKLFKHVSNRVVMKNSKNAPLYALFLASHNPTGVKIANEIFQRYERLKEVGK